MSDDYHPNFTRDRSKDPPPRCACVFCGEMTPVVVHAFCEEGHCERRPCVDKCQSCQDWFTAIEPQEEQQPTQKKATAEKHRVLGQWTVALTPEEKKKAEIVAEGICKARSRSRKYNNFNNRPLDTTTLGKYGEVAFSKLTGIPWQEELLLGGDDGIDFFTNKGSIDVKTARKAYNLLVKDNEIDGKTDLYVLARFEEPNVVTFLGWEMRSVMKDKPKKSFGYVTINHFSPASALRSMSSLVEGIVEVGRHADMRVRQGDQAKGVEDVPPVREEGVQENAREDTADGGREKEGEEEDLGRSGF